VEKSLIMQLKWVTISIECTEIVGDTQLHLPCEKAIYFLIHKSEWSKYWIVIFMSKSTSVSSITNIL
jgi:hypothetical protein